MFPPCSAVICSAQELNQLHMTRCIIHSAVTIQFCSGTMIKVKSSWRLRLTLLQSALKAEGKSVLRSSQEMPRVFISVRLSELQSHSIARRISSIEKIHDSVRNWTRNLQHYGNNIVRYCISRLSHNCYLYKFSCD